QPRPHPHLHSFPTRRSSDLTGWSTPILLQSVTATTATISWYNFLGGALAFSHTVSLTPGGGMRIDPWTYSQLAPDKQYSVVVDGDRKSTRLNSSHRTISYAV